MLDRDLPGLGKGGAFPVAGSLVWILFPREAVKHVRLAVFAVIDRDYFTIPARELFNIKNLMTGLGGKIVFRSPDF